MPKRLAFVNMIILPKKFLAETKSYKHAILWGILLSGAIADVSLYTWCFLLPAPPGVSAWVPVLLVILFGGAAVETLLWYGISKIFAVRAVTAKEFVPAYSLFQLLFIAINSVTLLIPQEGLKEFFLFPFLTLWEGYILHLILCIKCAVHSGKSRAIFALYVLSGIGIRILIQLTA